MKGRNKRMAAARAQAKVLMCKGPVSLVRLRAALDRLALDANVTVGALLKPLHPYCAGWCSRCDRSGR